MVTTKLRKTRCCLHALNLQLSLLVAQLRIKDGRGCLHPDTFAEDRLLLLPPGSAAILVLFNRNHNVSLQTSGPQIFITFV